ncbi:MAG: flagellar motor protein MotB [Gemmatimonadaceae bacterium]
MKKGDKRPIIIKKVVKGHGGHHGGAWKVAYADFVTAMMAFFMVMWILGMDESVKNSIQGYFSNPVGYKRGYSGGKSPISSGSSPASVKTSTPIMQVNRVLEDAQLGAVGGRIRSRLKDAGLTAIGDRIEIVKTQDGLRIELAEDQTGDQFFSMASAVPTVAMRKTLEIVSGELAPLKNPIILEGHTDAAQYAGLYSNWELSTDRANAARRVLEGAGLDPSRVIQVRGMADRELRNPENPLDPKNRRITILLPFVNPLPDSAGTAGPAGAVGHPANPGPTGGL